MVWSQKYISVYIFFLEIVSSFNVGVVPLLLCLVAQCVNGFGSALCFFVVALRNFCFALLVIRLLIGCAELPERLCCCVAALRGVPIFARSRIYFRLQQKRYKIAISLQVSMY